MPSPGGKLKAIYFISSSLKDLRRMPDRVKDVFGAALLDAQYGEKPEIAKPFSEGGRREIGNSHAKAR